eukprot:TRINITY_DN27694_c0_g1_i1.p1 TRINITY_DN27694_c0_g1~~TRINITY_DN27694_c0_g1_i1.p1  ORF type:complete len:287 (+),score=67.94 TRINITY_DN27694_c0_g1_i1:99-959(+)
MSLYQTYGAPMATMTASPSYPAVPLGTAYGPVVTTPALTPSVMTAAPMVYAAPMSGSVSMPAPAPMQMSIYGAPPAQQNPAAGAAIAAAFNALDSNHDGVISASEWDHAQHPERYQFQQQFPQQQSRGLSFSHATAPPAQMQAPNQYDTSDPVYNKDMQRLDHIANTVATATGMEQQIQELVEGQREFTREIEQIKAQINQNFAELDDLRRVADFARTHHLTKMEAARKIAEEEAAKARNAPKPPPSHPKNLGDPDAFKNLHYQAANHFNTVAGHASNAFSTFRGS